MDQRRTKLQIAEKQATIPHQVHRLLHNLANDELEGNTLNVYAYIVHVAKPVGTRDVTRGANLSSTSVAFRHLQKLEDMGLIEKNRYGDYILKEKTNINGHVWVGKNLVPRLMFYSFFFLGAFAAEITINNVKLSNKRYCDSG